MESFKVNKFVKILAVLLFPLLIGCVNKQRKQYNHICDSLNRLDFPPRQFDQPSVISDYLLFWGNIFNKTFSEYLLHITYNKKRLLVIFPDNIPKPDDLFSGNNTKQHVPFCSGIHSY